MIFQSLFSFIKMDSDFRDNLYLHFLIKANSQYLLPFTELKLQMLLFYKVQEQCSVIRKHVYRSYLLTALNNVIHFTTTIDHMETKYSLHKNRNSKEETNKMKTSPDERHK